MTGGVTRRSYPGGSEGVAQVVAIIERGIGGDDELRGLEQQDAAGKVRPELPGRATDAEGLGALVPELLLIGAAGMVGREQRPSGRVGRGRGACQRDNAAQLTRPPFRRSSSNSLASVTRVAMSTSG